MRYRIRVKRINQIFRRGSDYDARLARVAVLFEDLRLERLATAADSIESLDRSGVELRRFYFIRRSIGTLKEFAEALRLLNQSADFGPIRASFGDDAAAKWAKSIRFFERREPYLAKIRNDFGGHFGEEPARFVIEHLHDGPVDFEYESNQAAGTGTARLKFASEIVAISMGRHQLASEPDDHFRMLFRLVLAGYGHAHRCADMLTAFDLWPRFNGVLPA